MSYKIKQLKHDDKIFFYTKNAIKHKNIIGFYFDDLGFPQKIESRSIYGKIIHEKNKTIDCKNKSFFKRDIINLLNEFDYEVYQILYKFLCNDKRVSKFNDEAEYVDYHLTLKTKRYPSYIFKLLCENNFSDCNIEPKLLWNILNGRDK